MRELVNADHWTYDPFGGFGGYGGLLYDAPTALLASIAAAVHPAGYAVVPVGIPFPESREGVVY